MSGILIEDLFYLATLPIIAAIIHNFYSCCLGCRMKKPVGILPVYFAYCTISGALYLSPVPGEFKLLLNLALILCLTCFYNKNLKWKTGAALFIVAIMMLSDAVTQYFLYSLFPADPEASYVISLFLSKIVMLILEYMAVQLFTTYGDGTLSKWYWVFMLACPVISFWGIYRLNKHPVIEDMQLLYPAIAVGLIFINFFVFLLCDHILRYQAASAQAVNLRKQVSYFTSQYVLAEASQRDTMKIRHDIKNVLIGLQAKMETGEAAESRKILDSLFGSLKASQCVAHSGNFVVDSILNYKQRAAAMLDIPFRLDLRFPADLRLDAAVISVVLGNTLDNAIEACGKVSREPRYIKVQMHYQNESLFIRIENPYAGKIHTGIDGRIQSTKSDRKMHGIGLKSVRDTVDKAHGLLDIAFADGVFQVEVVLFNIHQA